MAATLSQVLVKEENGVKTFYVYGLGLLGEEKDGEYRSYHFDFRGSTVALTDKIGKVVQRFQYGPYGELLKGETSVTPFLFNGKYGVMADGNGLYYMRARFYSAAMKRFVNQDVLLGHLSEGQTLNRFAFVTGRPVSLVDPFGLEIISPELYENDAAYLKEKKVFNGSTIILISLIPGVGEALDLDVLLGISGPSSGWDKLGAGSSLGLSVLTGTLALNYGALARCEKFYNQYPADEIAVAMSKVIPNKMLKKVNGTFNYVVTKDGELIVGKSFSVPGGGHIDLANGQPVLAAGELKVVNGELKYVDNASGHYQPTGDSPRLVIEEILKDLGFDTTGKYLNKVWVPDPTLPRGGAWKPVK